MSKWLKLVGVISRVEVGPCDYAAGGFLVQKPIISTDKKISKKFPEPLAAVFQFGVY